MFNLLKGVFGLPFFMQNVNNFFENKVKKVIPFEKLCLYLHITN
jgi:hypothetical protein